MGCFIDRPRNLAYSKQIRNNLQKSIRIEKRNPNCDIQHVQDQDDKQINLILSPIIIEITQRKPDQILGDIVYHSEQCINRYNEHDIDTAFTMLIKIQKDIKQLEERGFQVEMNKHFKKEFIELSHVLSAEYQDMIDFNNQILRPGWKVQKEKKNFKVSSRVDGETVGILLQSVLQVPFQNFIAVMIQPDFYKQFLPFIEKSADIKSVRRNCKIGMIQMNLPIITNRQSYFQGIVYSRLNNQKKEEQQFFMYTRSIHNRKDLQKLYDYDVKLNPKCVPFQYKYIVVKYVPISQTIGKMIMGVNIDLKLNIIPMYILQMVSVSFSQDFFDNIVRISKNFQGSIWDQGIKKDPQLFNLTKKLKRQYLQKINK